MEGSTVTIKQLSVFIENTKGSLAQITRILGENHVDIRALSLADTSKFGILRLIVDDPRTAEQSLKKAGLTVTLTDVLAVAIQDQPGGLTAAVTALGDQVNIEYMYAFVSRKEGVANVILRVDDNARAEQLLLANGVAVLAENQVYATGD